MTANHTNPGGTWSTYEITWTWDDVGRSTIAAPSRGKALSMMFDRVRDPYPSMTWLEFRRYTRCRKVSTPKDDGYAQVRRQYGVDPTIGRRARLVNEGPMTGREGTIIYPGPSTCYVHVVLDGSEHASLVHPSNVEMLA